MEETCRICFSRTMQNAHSLLDKRTGDMLESLTCINIQAFPEGSTVICTKCYLNLKLAYRIQQNIIQSEEKLKRKHSKLVIIRSEVNSELLKPMDALITDKFCFICGLTPKGNNHFIAHFKKCQNCSICKSQFETFQSYKQHLPICQDQASYKCAECRANFRYKSFYDLHVVKLHRPNVEAEEGQPSDAEPEVDLPRVASKEKVNCGECGKQFKSKQSLALHSHRTRQCPICEKNVPFHRLHAHVKDHEGPHVCEFCGARMKNASCLRQHIFYMHNEPRYKCEDCGKEFKKKALFNLHIRKHKGQKSFICETCGRSFYQKEFLRRHINMTHLKLRPHICQYCQKGFSSLYAMRTHERQHTNETPYRCDICGEAFRQNVSLKSHKKSKHGITEAKTVKCQICDKAFASQQALIGHARLHK